MEPLNVFEHQRFLLRRPDGTRLKKSFREIVTEPDADYALDYPMEFFNVAALNLMAYLAQVAFEPETVDALLERIATPISDEAFDTAITPLRAHFRLTGDGPRFMQGPPLPDKKPEPLSVVMMISPKGDRQFLFRSDDRWGVSPEQAGLLLFMRNTFYEGTGGRGYQKGVNGDTPVRTLVIRAGENGTISLRKSLWLNVLSREYQYGSKFEGDYGQPGEDDVYDGLFWENPPSADVPVGKITLRAALGWMTAFHRLHFEETDEEYICPVTGESISGLVAITASKQSTGIAYGAKGDADAGTRAERFFRHPNVPTRRTRFDKKTERWISEQPFMVDRTRGFVDALGAIFFGSDTKAANAPLILAPVVAQCRERALLRSEGPFDLWVFGFHMLTDKRNVHGGYEFNTFRMAVPNVDDPIQLRLYNDIALQCMHAAVGTADHAAYALQQAIQRTAGVGVKMETDDHGNIRIGKTEKKSSDSYDFGREVLAAYWHDVEAALAKHAQFVASEVTNYSADTENRLNSAWHRRIRSLVWWHFNPVFDRYHVLPRTMPLAFKARQMLQGTLNKVAPLPELENVI